MPEMVDQAGALCMLTKPFTADAVEAVLAPVLG
jgi:hypothetical protein